MRAFVFAVLISVALGATQPKKIDSNILKIVGDVKTGSNKALAQDVALAQLAVANTMAEVHVQDYKFLQLHYLIIVDVANKAEEIFSKMQTLGVPQDTIDQIQQSAFVHFSEYQGYSNEVQLTYDEMRPTLHVINEELHNLNSTLSQSQIELNSLKQRNDDNYLTSISVVDTMIADVESQIQTSISGMSGQEVIDIYIALNDIKTLISNKEEDLERVRAIFDISMGQTMYYLDLVIGQLP